MSTLDSAFLIVAAVSFSLFFLILIALIVYAWITYVRLIRKAEAALASVESATHIITQVGSKASAKTLIKLLKYISNLARKG